MTSFLFYLFMTLFIIVCLFMILLILIQKGRGGGLSSAFGGAGGNTAFGSKTGDVLTWATSIVFGVFLLLAIILNLLANSQQHATARGPLPADVPPPPAETTDGAATDGAGVGGDVEAQSPPVEAPAAPDAPVAPTTQPQP